jgi:hypothetical protein
MYEQISGFSEVTDTSVQLRNELAVCRHWLKASQYAVWEA